MLIPSYAELMEILNKESEKSQEITSRYTIVIATAKRARQLIDGDEAMVVSNNVKPVSTAVEEIFNNKIKVVPEGEGTVLNIKKHYEPHNRDKEEFDKTNTMRKCEDINMLDDDMLDDDMLDDDMLDDDMLDDDMLDDDTNGAYDKETLKEMESVDDV